MSAEIVKFHPDDASGEDNEVGLLPKSEHMNFIEWSELIGWRRLSGRLTILVEEVVAARGDRADDDLLSLQHELVQLNTAPQIAKMMTDFSNNT